MAWRLSFQMFLPIWDGFVVGSSALGSDDTLGIPDTTRGDWVDVTCEVMEVETVQGYRQNNPFNHYDGGSATIKLKGIRFSPETSNLVVGSEIRVLAYQAVSGWDFDSADYNVSFLSSATQEQMHPIFYGYVTDINVDDSEIVGSEQVGTVTLTAIDEYYKVIKAIYKRPDTNASLVDKQINWTTTDIANWMATPVEDGGAGVRLIYDTLPSTQIVLFDGGDNTHTSILKAENSIHGSLYVRDDYVIWRGREVWDLETPVAHISDVHDVDDPLHICYSRVDKNMRLNELVNSISQINDTYTVNAQNSYTFSTTTTRHSNEASVTMYNRSEQVVNTSVAGWSGTEYLQAAQYPVMKTRAVTIALTKNNLSALPNVMDTVQFTFKGTTETRKVAEKRIRFLPSRMECDLEFFDWTLGEIAATPQSEPVHTGATRHIKHLGVGTR